MKAFGLIALVLVLGICGWLAMQQLQSGSKSSGGLDNGGGVNLKRAEDSAKLAVAKDNLDLVKHLVDTYKMQNGKWPASLEDLKTAGMIDSVPPGLSYDPETGEVKAQ